MNTLTHLRKYLPASTLLTIYKSVILPLMEYANLVNTLIPCPLTTKLQRLQNKALKTIFSCYPQETMEDLHIRAKLCPLKQRADKQLTCLMYKRSRCPEVYPQVEDNTITTRTTVKIKVLTTRNKTGKIQAISTLSRCHSLGQIITRNAVHT